MPKRRGNQVTNAFAYAFSWLRCLFQNLFIKKAAIFWQFSRKQKLPRSIWHSERKLYIATKVVTCGLMSLARYSVKREAHSLAVPVKLENNSSHSLFKSEKISQLPTAIAVNRSFLFSIALGPWEEHCGQRRAGTKTVCPLSSVLFVCFESD